jgi:hypothetical protein
MSERSVSGHAAVGNAKRFLDGVTRDHRPIRSTAVHPIAAGLTPFGPRFRAFGLGRSRRVF